MPFIFSLLCVMLSPPRELNFAVYTILCSCVTQVFMVVLWFLYTTLKDTPPEKWKDVLLSYDNMCNLNNLRAARVGLSLPSPYDELWLKVTKKIIDSFHIQNHKQQQCKIVWCQVKRIERRISSP